MLELRDTLERLLDGGDLTEAEAGELLGCTDRRGDRAGHGRRVARGAAIEGRHRR